LHPLKSISFVNCTFTKSVKNFAHWVSIKSQITYLESLPLGIVKFLQLIVFAFFLIH
jgi:hypothetical protein